MCMLHGPLKWQWNGASWYDGGPHKATTERFV
jgi:hypothetical protein